MKYSVNLAALKMNGHDPRHNKAFLLLSREISTLRKGKNTGLQWPVLEEQCYQVFRQYGFDLMTGSWFCLISAHLYGWQGLAQALDLMKEVQSPRGERCWPAASAPEQRRAILDWFCQHVATMVYTLPQHADHIPMMQRVESGIAAICMLAQECQSRNQDSLNNLRYFLQVRSRSVGHFSAVSTTAAPIAKELVSEDVVDNASDDVVSAESVPGAVLNNGAKTPFTWLNTVVGMFAGAALTLGGVGLHVWLNQPSEDQHIAAPLLALRQADKLNEASSSIFVREKDAQTRALVIDKVDKQLAWLEALPATFLLEKGQLTAERLDRLYPGNPATLNWRNALQQKSDTLGPLDGWQAASQHLDILEQRLLESEKTRSRYMTVSELKTAIYQLRQDLQNEEAPAEALLARMQRQHALHQQISVALTQQTERKIDGIVARYQLMKELIEEGEVKPLSVGHDVK